MARFKIILYSAAYSDTIKVAGLCSNTSDDILVTWGLSSNLKVMKNVKSTVKSAPYEKSGILQHCDNTAETKRNCSSTLHVLSKLAQGTNGDNTVTSHGGIVNTLLTNYVLDYSAKHFLPMDSF